MVKVVGELEQLVGRHIEGAGQGVDHADRGALLASLDLAEVGPAHPGVARQVFLGEATVVPRQPEGTAQAQGEISRFGHAATLAASLVARLPPTVGECRLLLAPRTETATAGGTGSMADQPSGAAKNSKQPSWAWVLLLGLPGALIAGGIAKDRGITLHRSTWALAWVVSGAGVVLGVVLSLALPHHAVNTFSPSSAAQAGSNPFDYGIVPSPPVSTPLPTPTPVPGAALSLGPETATWQDNAGYSYQATITLGHITAYQAGMTVKGTKGEAPLIGGTAGICDLTPGADAIVPMEVVLTNTTGSYASDIMYSVIYDKLAPGTGGNSYQTANPAPVWQWLGSNDPEPMTQVGGSENCDLHGGTLLTCRQVEPQHSCVGLFFVVLKNFYGPTHPDGDPRQLTDIGVALGVHRYHDGCCEWDFPNTMDGPEVKCDGQGNCAVPLAGLVG